MEVAKAILDDIYGFFKTEGGELSIPGMIVKVLLILIVTRIVIKIAYMAIDKFFEKQERFKYKIESRKAKTLGYILKSICKYILYFIAIISILQVFNIPIASILAAAGIGGVAIGFGAQSLVKDIITGFFILFEDQYGVGDHIKTGEFEGIVEDMGLRVTKIRGFNGELNIIPNGSISTVTNKCKGSMRAWVDISIAYEEDIDNAIAVIDKISKDIRNNNDNIVEGPTVLGVSNLGGSDVVLSVIAKTKPMEQWGVERQMRKSIKQAFDKEGIEIPYQKHVIIKDNE
ncbi:mechanosensitive ion channel family protein [Dethiothermospora halolimnae]|uniref:mechanosensitive ion channel family protein n=1 Tax=Dethiothermospora halolimnae TaxID=3114390 RepID=UPI003CCBA8D6